MRRISSRCHTSYINTVTHTHLTQYLCELIVPFPQTPGLNLNNLREAITIVSLLHCKMAADLVT